MISYPKRGALAGQETSVVPLLAGLGVLSYPRTMATSLVPVVVCTAGVWSVRIAFRPCDDFRITIDGPSADQTQISATLEFDG